MKVLKVYQLRRQILGEDEQYIEKQLDKIIKKFNKVAAKAVKKKLNYVSFTIKHMTSEIEKFEIFNKFISDMRNNGYKVSWYEVGVYNIIGNKNYTNIVISWD